MMKTFKFDSCQFSRGTFLVLLSVIVLGGRAASAQALPAAEAAPVSTGFALPTSLGSLQYAVTASQSLISGYYSNSGLSSSTSFSGDLAYLSSSQRHPFSAVISGGRSFAESSQGSYTFANLGLSQVANFGRWNFVVSDSVSYLPGTPVSGLSGIPGLGDLGVSPVQIGTDSGQGLLTNYSNRVTNTAGGTLSRQITSKTSINASGSYGIYRFVDSGNNTSNSSSSGLDNDSVSGSGGISHQVDARTSYGANYTYANFTYPNDIFGVLTPDFDSQTVSGFVSHNFTRRLSANLSIGPQWIKLSTSGSSPSLGIFVSAGASYSARRYSANASFSRNTNSGFGAVGGTISNSANFTYNRTFAVVWNFAGTGGYTQSSNLPGPSVSEFSSKTYIAGAQMSRAIVRNLSCYASYTLQRQSTMAVASVDLYSGTSQTLGFGITYSSSALHLGRK